MSGFSGISGISGLEFYKIKTEKFPFSTKAKLLSTFFTNFLVRFFILFLISPILGHFGTKLILWNHNLFKNLGNFRDCLSPSGTLGLKIRARALSGFWEFSNLGLGRASGCWLTKITGSGTFGLDKMGLGRVGLSGSGYPNPALYTNVMYLIF